VAETFAAVGDIASNLLHHLNNKVGTIPVRIQGIEDKLQDVIAVNPYLARNLDEIEHCATDAMDSVRESLSHLRPIKREPVLVLSRVHDALRLVKMPPGIEVRISDLDHLPVVMAGGAYAFAGLYQPDRKCHRCHESKRKDRPVWFGGWRVGGGQGPR
jgi:hypothetical protein